MRKLALNVVAAILLIGFAAVPAAADWVAADGHKMHFPQLPDSVGWNVRATFPYVLADDWTCSETGWVKDIHFWGSWVNGIDGEIIQFELSIHADIPANPPLTPYSRPGEELWKREIPFPDFVIAPVDGLSWQGWYDPVTGWYNFNDHQKYYQYNVFLDSLDWFWQDAGTVYWLNISATIVDPQNTQWGWKSSVNHHLDDAVWAEMPIYNWVDLWEPPEFLESLDLSFVITGGPDEPIGACCYPDPVHGVASLCIETTQDDCINNYLGIYQGDGTVCGGLEACCLPDGSCIDADVLCCVNELGGVPQGAGTSCTAPVACCLSDGTCIDVDPLCCDDMGGISQGPGFACTQPEACCLSDGSCIMVDPICCDDMGGTPQGLGTSCSANTVACCLTDGSCVDVDPLCCDDLGGTISTTSPICLGDVNGNTIDDACEEPEPDTCTYYKPPYNDYAPAGMPDFDQKQDNWIDTAGNWSHCGPVALANCLWWFDSKFELATSPPPPAISDSYGLLYALGAWDDHDAQNVMPFVDSLALYCKTNQPGQTGTNVFDLDQGARDWMTAQGLGGSYTVSVYPIELGVFDFESIRSEVLISQDVILLLGFWQEVDVGYCEWVGGHFVTVAGVCSEPDDSTICVSDPFYDKNEGDPPPPHGAGIHNDAQFVSGPHGTMHHDSYDVVLSPCQMLMPPFFHAELANYPVNAGNVALFYGQNSYDPTITPIPPQPGMPIHTIIEYAIVICPAEEPTGACCYPDPNTLLSLCTVTTQNDCVNNLNGVYEGDGTQCGTVQGCCLADGSCIDADSLCCVRELGGIPKGTGNNCGPTEACCLADGICQDLDPFCCDAIGGVAQGAGTSCSANTIACCLTDGSCIDVDPLCCDDMGGTPSPIGAPACMGDTDGNGIDDACETPITGACCWTDGTCTMETQADCVNNGGDYKGDGIPCVGDINNDGIDDVCQDLWPNHKMHFPQLPDEAGWDVFATADPNLQVNLADDWLCTETGWVKDLHWWGSWKGGLEAPILIFAVRIWSDIPASESPTGYSMPGDILWEKALNPTMVPITSPTPEGWYNPAINEVIPNDHNVYYRYDVMLDSLDWFWQEEGTIYWLSIICAHMGSSDRQWGWKSSQYHFMDDAVWGLEADWNWIDIWEPPDFEVSLDLAFVITAGAEPIGACCYDNPAGETALCVETTQDSCLNYYGGIYEGDGTVCSGMEACCLPGGACIDADPICCINELGGVPQGAGTVCTVPEACCLSDGSCINVDPLCCDDMGGTPQGPGTSCSANTVACCLTDGSCVDVDPLCCDDLGGTVSPFSPVCLGDADGNTIDDACEGGACCWTDGTCTMETEADCINNGGDYKGDGTSCLGDINGNGTDDICEELWPGHKMHFPQLPDEAGWDVCANGGAIAINLADDWQCSETGWVKDLHWWGSWKGGVEAPILAFGIRIWSNIPADESPTGYSMPGDILWERAPYPDMVSISSPTPEGWYNPESGEFNHPDHQRYYRYDLYLDSLDWFWQEEGNVYWLSIICVHLGSTDVQWGWKSSQYHFMDDAVWGLEGEWGWIDIWEPPDFEISLDLAFVITAGVEPTGACCYENAAGEFALCIETTQDSCLNVYGGVYEGDGTGCTGMEACCLPGGACIDADPICCINELGGVPQGPGTVCTVPEACCLTDGSCINVDPLCCDDMGGTPQGTGTQCATVQACCMSDGSCQNMDSLCCLTLGGTPQGTGTSCSANTVACCLTDGSCIDVDPICCDDMGGFISPWSAVCLGDGDMNGIDDACEQPMGACCWTDGSCTMETETDCVSMGGDYKGDGTHCLGDFNGNGIDDICENLWPGHKMHYPQLPDEAGWDVFASAGPTMPVNLADDWRCTESGWVKDLHWWGSWKGGVEAPILFFGLRIWSDIPAIASPTGYSMPGDILWERVLTPDITGIDPPTPEGWYNPATTEILPNDHQRYYRYDLYLDSLDWFWQNEGSIYWLSIICSHMGPIETQWGWKSSIYHFMDDAVWGLEDDFNWIDLWEPPDFDTSMDLAFVITDGTCDCIPGDAQNDGTVNVADAVYIINYVFKGGPPPVPYTLCSGDANCDCQLNVGDAVYVINYVFKNGPPPCDCKTWLARCGPPLRK